ncbi:hypothetical protein C475_09989 [Halosimplex carlsbadense 2-9-1]|uniref:DUF7319 domain-containing protein n=1 Tax=Halosimplex carlsbadense 2-9-1 TaxID=797114 RepID=M0CRC8_9EURY|nr:hypothetical protein [Halosimplex carlsbadense]ELZ25781.1 hypothetical protein C475_09989 [Halosimplex carlsbadense 2-9-1]
MSDAADERVDGAGEAEEASGADGDVTGDDAESIEALRERVEAEYDFDDFGPAEMASMSADEWEAVFDAESWITGQELLDRVEADLKRRVAEREVFARVERRDDRLVAYSDEGYATVRADGSVEGHGTVLRDVKPTVALASMESYDVPEAPPEDLLPEPQEVPEGSGELGNTMLQVIAGIQVLAGLVLVGGWLVFFLGVVSPPGGGSVRSLNVIAMLLGGFVFLAVGVLLFGVVANARLSDKFRAEEYRNRLRAVELEPGERPDFLPDEESSAGAAGIPGEASEGLPGEGGDERPSESGDGEPERS